MNHVSVSRDGLHQSLTNGKFPFKFDWLMRILIKKRFYRSAAVSERKDLATLFEHADDEDKKMVSSAPKSLRQYFQVISVPK